MDDIVAEEAVLNDKIIYINRVAKVVKGGRRFSFSAVVVVGDGEGKVGLGLGKANEVPEAIRKAIDKARKNMVMVSLKGTTIPHEVMGVYGGSKVFMKPASKGTGVKAGGPARAVLEVVGVRDILAKSLGSRNQHNVAHATLAGLMQLRDAKMVASERNLSEEDINR